MIHIALVDDEIEMTETVRGYLHRYESENPIKFRVTVFSNAVALLENYQADYDIIFMDIRMPYMNGMDAAHRLRALDQKVLLLFFTGLTQYAIAGYEVDAMDYIVKPVNYYDFALKLERAIRRVPAAASNSITLRTDVGLITLDTGSIRYVETEGHHLIYHSIVGDYQQYSSLSSAEKELAPYGFSRCNRCYLVNLQYVQSIKGYHVTLDNCTLDISQPRKKAFLQAYADYTGR